MDFRVYLRQNFGTEPAEFPFYVGKNGYGVFQGDHILAVGISAGDSPRQPFKIVDLLQAFLDIVPCNELCKKLRNAL